MLCLCSARYYETPNPHKTKSHRILCNTQTKNICKPYTPYTIRIRIRIQIKKSERERDRREKQRLCVCQCAVAATVLVIASHIQSQCVLAREQNETTVSVCSELVRTVQLSEGTFKTTTNHSKTQVDWRGK